MILLLFVAAWINIVVQAPLHAAMKMDIDLPCHCDTTLCDTVLNLEETSDDGAQSIHKLQTQFVTSYTAPVLLVDEISVSTNRYILSNTSSYTYNPPPILKKTVLLI